MIRWIVGGNRAGRSVRPLALVAILGMVVLSTVGQRATAASLKPDIFGIFIGIGPGRPDIDPRWRNKPFSPTPEFTKWGAEESRKLGRLGTETGTPGACEPVTPVQFMVANGLFPIQILQGSNQIVMLNEWVAVPRRIYMDGRGHPSDLDPTWLGHSIGHWEGDVLVIDTVRLNGRSRPLNGYAANAVSSTKESAKDPRLPASDQMHIVERLRLVGDGNLLEVTMTITDPKTYVRPFTSIGYLERRPDIDVQEYYCADNMRPRDEGHAESGKTP
jgi:hypothetical protein